MSFSRTIDKAIRCMDANSWLYASIDDIIDIEPYTDEVDKSNDGTVQGGGLNELQQNY